MARFSGSSGSGIPANISESELLTLDGVVSAIQTQIDGKQAVVANVSNTEIGYLDGVTSAIQTQIDTKLATATAASTYQAINANVSTTELGYLDGVTSAIQTQLNDKLSTSTASSTYQPIVSGVDNTEIGYLNGVTSSIQTQLDAKIAKSLTTTTGDIIYASGANTPARLGIGSTNQVLTVASGIPTWAAPSGAPFSGMMVHRDYSGTPSVPTNTITWLTWMHDTYDTSNFHSESTNLSRFVMPLTGYYLINAYVSFNFNYGNALGSYRLLIRKNGSGTVYERDQAKQNTGYSTGAGTTGGGALSGLHATWILPATANDYFEVGAYQDTNGTVTAGGGGHADSVVISYLGA